MCESKKIKKTPAAHSMIRKKQNLQYVLLSKSALIAI